MMLSERILFLKVFHPIQSGIATQSIETQLRARGVGKLRNNQRDETHVPRRQHILSGLAITVTE
jgi:hypothetical protein